MAALATVIWGGYATLNGFMAILFDYTQPILWVSIIVAIVGNSASLVAFHLTKNANGSTSLDISSSQKP